MSLTSQIREKNGPLWGFLKEYENTDGLKSVTGRLKAASAPIRPNYDGSYKYSVVGTAFPYLAHTMLPINRYYGRYKVGEPVNLKFNIADSVPFQLANHKNLLYWEYKYFIDEFLKIASELLQKKRNKLALAKGAIILAVLEISSRGGQFPSKLVESCEEYNNPAECMDEYLKYIGFESLASDLSYLVGNFLEHNKSDHPDLIGAKYFCFDKTLMHAKAVGGADIDCAIVREKDISIIDYKTLLKPIDDDVTRQLISYALLWDSKWDGDSLNLTKIGIYYVRTSELKEVSLKSVFSKVFPATPTLAKTRSQLISYFLDYSKTQDAIKELKALSNFGIRF